MGQCVRSEREGPILLITMNEPHKLNALSAQACFELSDLWDEYEKDDELRVAILTGEGRAFSAGHDLADDMDAQMPESGWGGLSRRNSLNKPIIAAVNGMALGGGWEVALACDIVIADENASFGLPEPHVGLAALGGGAFMLPLRMPWHMAMRYLLTGERMDARTAHHHGLVSDIAPAGTVVDVARRYAEAIIAGAPLGIEATKAVARAALQSRQRQEEMNDMAEQWARKLVATEDMQEGIRAFMEKRKPRWTGR